MIYPLNARCSATVSSGYGRTDALAEGSSRGIGATVHDWRADDRPGARAIAEQLTVGAAEARRAYETASQTADGSGCGKDPRDT